MSDLNIVKEMDSNRDQHLSELKALLNTNALLVKVNFEDKLLLKFLRAKLFDVKATFNSIQNYFDLFKKFPEFFKNVEYSRCAIESGAFQLFAEKNVTGERIANICLGKWDPKLVSFESLIAATVYGVEVAEMEEETQLNGAIEIVDCENVGLKQFMKIGITQVRLASGMSENSLPIRWRKIFVCNENNFVDLVFKMAKPLLSKEFKESIEFIGQDFTKMHKVVPPELLPSRYGGTSDKCDSSTFFKELKEKEHELLRMWQPFKKAVIECNTE